MRSIFINFSRQVLKSLLMLAVLGQPFSAMAKAENVNKSIKQDRTVTGKITSKEDGAGIPGVNVVLKGTQKGSTTPAVGHYSIEISGDNSEQGLMIPFVIKL